MLWLDERIFGWNRSASVGQSVWSSSAANKQQESEAAPASPYDSEGEEEEADVDYDDVLAIIDTRRSGGGGVGLASPKGKKRRYTGQARSEASAASPKSDPEGVPLPRADDNGVTKLHKRPGAAKDGISEAKGEGGLGLDTGREKGQ